MITQRSLTIAFLVGLLILILTGGALLLANLTRMQPQHDGIVYASGLHGPVEIIRDDFGVPHIYASTVDDLFFAQGYVHAQDRWWQMETARHTGQGRLSALTGADAAALRNDLMIHTWDLAPIETSLSTATDLVLAAYSAGVNAVIGGQPGGDLALEYTLLELAGHPVDVEPWQPIDSLTGLQLLANQMHGNARHEIERAVIYETLGADLADAYFPPYPYDRRPTILTAEDLGLQPSTGENVSQPRPPDYEGLSFASTLLLAQQSSAQQIFDGNSWVLNGAHTATDAPMLAGDSHASIQIPASGYQMGLHCRPVTEECPFDVVGFSTPGIPAILNGYNEALAWNISNAHADTQDLYVLRLNPADPTQYEYEGEWRDILVSPTVIPLTVSPNTDHPGTPHCEGISDLPLNDDGNLVIQIRSTQFGPIITDNSITSDCRFVAIPDDVAPLALRQVTTAPDNNLRSLLDINHATTQANFRTALAQWTGPAMNVVYAIQNNDIGYQLVGSVPVRAEAHSGVFPVPGWTDRYEWRGWLPADNLPHITNPVRDWIVVADQAVMPTAYHAYLIEQLADEFGPDTNPAISQFWPDGYRAVRIEQQITATAAHTIGRQSGGSEGTLAALQADSHNVLAEELLPHLASVAFEEETLRELAEWLIGWDLQNTTDSPQAVLFETFWATLIDGLYNDQLPFPSAGPAWATIRLLDQPDHTWWDNTTTPDIIETRDDMLRQTFAEAVDTVQRQWGLRPENWHWGDLHPSTFLNMPPGHNNGLFNLLFNRGPFTTGGGINSINHTAYAVQEPFATNIIPEQRAIYDLSNPDNSLGILTTGQSGHPLSLNYDDMIELWRTFDYRPLPFGDEAVARAAHHTLELRPAAPVHNRP